MHACHTRIILLGTAILFVTAAHVSAQTDPSQGVMMRDGDRDPVDTIRAAYSEGHFDQVVVFADRAILNSTEETAQALGEIRFWRASALRRLKRHEEALVAFEAAEAAGFTGPELYLERAVSLRALGRQDEAERAFQEAERQAQEDPDRLEELRRRWRESQDPDKRFQLRVYPQFGYDSNIFSINDDTILAEEVDRESFYYGARLDARYLLFHSDRTSLLIGFQTDTHAYASEFDRSSMDNLLSVVWQAPAGNLDWLSYQVRASLGEAWLKEDGHFRTLRSAGATLLFRPSETWELRLAFDGSNLDFYESAPDEQDRDGNLFQLRLEAAVQIEGGWKVSPYLLFRSYSADGSDYDSDSYGLGASVTPPEVMGLEFTVGLGALWAKFDNPHSLTGFTEERDDFRLSFSVTIKLRFLEKSIGFAPAVTVGYENWSSNVDAFDFDRFDVGATADILALSF